MNLPIRAALLLSTFWLCLATAGPAAAKGPWKAGAARVNITPQRLMWMSGYASRSRPADGKLTDLWAKALVLDDGAGGRGLLVTLDLIGIDRGLSQAVRQSLQKKYSLRREQIALCTSHTHTGPVVAKNLKPMHYLLLDARQQKLVDEYAQFVQRKIVEVVGQAEKRLAPAELSWGSGTCSVAVNRRNNPASKVPELRATGTLRGPVDHDVPVLAIRDAAGKLSAVVFGYACHATVLSSYQWSGDYPGFAQIELEKAHAGCVAMFWAGCGADQNPLPRRKVELARQYGRDLATSVDNALSAKMTPVSGPLKATYEELDLPLGKLPTLEELTRDAADSNRYVAARAKSILADLNAGEPLESSYPYPIATWELGDQVHWVFLGGEVVVDYALRLKSELRGKNTWVAGYANDVMAYIPSRRVLTEGGYEGGGAMVYYGLPTVWAPEVEKVIVDHVHEQLKRR